MRHESGHCAGGIKAVQGVSRGGEWGDLEAGLGRAAGLTREFGLHPIGREEAWSVGSRAGGICSDLSFWCIFLVAFEGRMGEAGVETGSPVEAAEPPRGTRPGLGAEGGGGVRERTAQVSSRTRPERGQAALSPLSNRKMNALLRCIWPRERHRRSAASALHKCMATLTAHVLHG